MMIGNMLKMTTATMVVLVIIISLLLRRAEAIGKETPEEYHMGYHDRPLGNKQHHTYQEYHQHPGYFPRPGHGYSKPRPKPRETPCSCKNTVIVPAAEVKSFQEHWITASLMGCTLATGSNEDELRRIRQVAIDFVPVQPSGGFLWIGLASEPTTDGSNGDVGGPFGWIDGCTLYTEDVFIRPTNEVLPDFVTDANEASDVGEHDGEVFLGVVDFDVRPGTIRGIPNVNSLAPAIYECCVNKSYRPQKYVLGSPHETKKKKILHARSPYIP